MWWVSERWVSQFWGAGGRGVGDTPMIMPKRHSRIPRRCSNRKNVNVTAIIEIESEVKCHAETDLEVLSLFRPRSTHRHTHTDAHTHAHAHTDTVHSQLHLPPKITSLPRRKFTQYCNFEKHTGQGRPNFWSLKTSKRLNCTCQKSQTWPPKTQRDRDAQTHSRSPGTTSQVQVKIEWQQKERSVHSFAMLHRKIKVCLQENARWKWIMLLDPTTRMSSTHHRHRHIELFVRTQRQHHVNRDLLPHP